MIKSTIVLGATLGTGSNTTSNATLTISNATLTIDEANSTLKWLKDIGAEADISATATRVQNIAAQGGGHISATASATTRVYDTFSQVVVPRVAKVFNALAVTNGYRYGETIASSVVADVYVNFFEHILSQNVPPITSERVNTLLTKLKLLNKTETFTEEMVKDVIKSIHNETITASLAAASAAGASIGSQVYPASVTLSITLLLYLYNKCKRTPLADRALSASTYKMRTFVDKEDFEIYVLSLDDVTKLGTHSRNRLTTLKDEKAEFDLCYPVEKYPGSEELHKYTMTSDGTIKMKVMEDIPVLEGSTGIQIVKEKIERDEALSVIYPTHIVMQGKRINFMIMYEILYTFVEDIANTAFAVYEVQNSTPPIRMVMPVIMMISLLE
mgnify:CR=1 FL=1|tara:strand:- start:8048 stop:9205 length:1158 start_codon:yes stop_codon:yes gene_type:complete